MAEALTIDIVLQSEQAQRAIEQFTRAMEKAGFAAEDTAKEVKKFEQEYAKAAIASDKAAKAADAAAEATHGQSSAVRSLSAAIGQYVGPAVLVAGIKQSLAFADSIKELSQQSGFSIKAVQTLGHVASLAGSSFQSVANAAFTLDKNLSVATPRTERAVKDLGFSIDELLAMQPEDRFRAVGIAIGSMVDPAKRAEIQTALFNRSGVELLATFQDLAEGAEQYAPRMSTAWVEHMAKVNDAWDTAWATMKGMGAWLLTFPIHQAMTAWDSLRQTMDNIRLVMGGTPDMGLPPVPGAPTLPGRSGFAGPAALGGNSMAYWERLYGQGIGRPPSARGGAGGEAGAGYQFSGGTPIPLGGSLGFPGWYFNQDWALPPWLQAGSPWAGPMPGFAPTVGMNAPGGGGSRLGNFFRGTGGRIAGMGLGMLSGLIPGMSGTGSSIGSLGGSVIGSMGSLAGSAIGSFLGPIGGLVGGLFGKLFGPREGVKTNRTRDAFIAEQFGSVDALREAADKAGFSVDRLLTVKKVKDFEAEVKKLNQAISDSEKDSLRVGEAMDRWGLTIQDMGPKFQQTKINDAFKEAMEDLRVLTNAGADFNVVAEKMAPTLGAMVHEAIEMGGTVPREMEPIIKKMIEMGILTDKNGDKFTELSQIPFAADLNKDFQTLIQKMDQLITRISQLPGAFDAAARAAQGLADTTNGIDIGGGNGGGGGGGGGGGTDTAMMSGSQGAVVAPVINVAGYLDSPSARRHLADLVAAELSKTLRGVRSA